MSLRLLGDRVLIRPDGAPTTSASGLLALPDHYAADTTGCVIALGVGPRAEDGTLLPHHVALGDRVVFSPNAGHDIVYQGEHLIVIREGELLGAV